MSDPQQNEPTEDELVAFAAELVGGTLGDDDLLRETVREARDLWIQLYRATKDA